MVLSRRDLMQGAAAGGFLLGFPGLAAPFGASAAPAVRPLLDRVGEVCARLAPKGWRALLLAVSRDTLDIGAPDLAEALARPIADLDRTVPGFPDFAPGLATLYHALASADVLTDGEGRSLGASPTLADIEAVEDYVYGVRPPTLDRLRAIAGDNALGVVVFAVDYRAATGSVHGRHADLCFSRTGIARMGTVEPFYDARARQFTPADPKRPFVFRTVPQRFAPYIASPRLLIHYGYAAGSCPTRDAAPAIVADGTGWTWTARVGPTRYQWMRLDFVPVQRSRTWLPDEFARLTPQGTARAADVTWRLSPAAAGPGWFAVGDAAARLDPASSHGVLRALLSGWTAGCATAAALDGALDPREAAAMYQGWLHSGFEQDIAHLAGMYAELGARGFG